MRPIKYEKAELARRGGPNNRWIIPPTEGGWTEPVLMEWELTGELWSDQHTHTEYAYVLEGSLFVECGGVTVQAGPGDAVQIPAHAIARYWAPKYARMLGIYGANPLGGSAKVIAFKKLKEGGTSEV